MIIISITVGKDPQKKWSRPHNQQKSSKCSFWCNLKNNRTISVCFQSKPFNITVNQVYAPTTNAEEASVEWFYEDLQDLLELTPKKDNFFFIGDWNTKVGNQEIPGVQASLALKYKMKQGKG